MAAWMPGSAGHPAPCGRPQAPARSTYWGPNFASRWRESRTCEKRLEVRTLEKGVLPLLRYIRKAAEFGGGDPRRLVEIWGVSSLR